MSGEHFDKRQFLNMEASLRTIVDKHYNLCLSKCNAQAMESGFASCKQNCYSNIFAKYKYLMHQATDNEESLYRQCLADKLPNITQEDYARCTNVSYSHRAEILLKHFGDTAEEILHTIH